MAEHKSLYQRAFYYDIALSRDVAPEINFFEAVYYAHCGVPLTSLLEIACGPGYHSIAAAQRNIRAIGLDLSEDMIHYARNKAEQASVDVTFIVGDMREFDLPQPVHMAVCTFDSLDALTQTDDVLLHLQAVARNLVDGGLYLLHFTHPRDSSLMHYGAYHYHGERDGVTVQINWAVNQPQFDLITAVANVDIEMIINDHGEELIIQDSAQEHLFSPQELALLARSSGVFSVVGWYGDFDIHQPLDHSPQSHHMIIVLKKEPR